MHVQSLSAPEYSEMYTHKYILQFDVPVHYLVGVEIDQSHAELLHGMGDIHLTEMLTV